MDRRTSPETCKNTLHGNLDKLDEILFDGSPYPILRRNLSRRGNALADRLKKLLEYAVWFIDAAEENGEEEKIHLSVDDIFRGIEFMVSFETLREKYGGGVNGWWHSLFYFEALGLLYVFKPDNHRKGLSLAQKYSKTRAEKSGRRSVSWYRFPEFNDDVLTRAEIRARQLEGVPLSKMTKDTVRGILGEDVANMAHDTAYAMSQRVLIEREAIERAMVDQISRCGYTSPSRVITSVYQDLRADLEGVTVILPVDGLEGLVDGVEREWMPRELHSMKRIENTYEAFKTELMRKLDVKYSRPTAEEMKKWSLPSMGWIIRRKSEA